MIVKPQFIDTKRSGIANGTRRCTWISLGWEIDFMSRLGWGSRKKREDQMERRREDGVEGGNARRNI